VRCIGGPFTFCGWLGIEGGSAAAPARRMCKLLVGTLQVESQFILLGIGGLS
jgi:hypothetical protein